MTAEPVRDQPRSADALPEPAAPPGHLVVIPALPPGYDFPEIVRRSQALKILPP